jgi:hypothetical protein
MTLQEFFALVLQTFPNAFVEEDNYGQLVVYTGMQHDGDDVVPFAS